MSDRNHITVRGRVGTDPQLYVTAAGTELTTFRLGSTPSYRDNATGEWRDGRTEWFTVKVWGNPGPNVRASIRRGDPVIVQGKLVSEEWESAETATRRYGLSITASTIGVDVKYGEVRFTKTTRETAATGTAEDTATDESATQPTTPVAALSGTGPDPDGTGGAEDRFAPELVDPGEWEKAGGRMPAS